MLFPTTFLNSGEGNDADAQAFIDAAGITGETQQNAINQLVLDLKGTGSTTNNTDVWSKCYAVYPMPPVDESTISLSSIKWNLKDARDLDEAFRLTFSNAPTADLSLGLNSNATPDSYAETHFIESSHMTAGNNGATTFITRFNSSVLGYFSGGSIDFCARITFNNFIQYSGNQLIFKGSFPAVGDIYTSSRRSATDFEAYTNGVSYGTETTSTITQTSDGYKLLCRVSGGSPVQFQDGAIGFYALHDGLTDNEVVDIYDAITAYNTTLGR
jgi:hypothetical protein